MKSTQTLDTPASVYSVAFSPCGTLLVAGTGSHHGLGKLLTYPVDLHTGQLGAAQQELALTRKHHLGHNGRTRTEPVSATALHFSGDGRQLWLCTSGAYRSGGTLLRLACEHGQFQPSLLHPFECTHRGYPDALAQVGDDLWLACHEPNGRLDAGPVAVGRATLARAGGGSARLLALGNQLITPSHHNQHPGLSFLTPSQAHGHNPDAARVMETPFTVLCMAPWPEGGQFLSGDSGGQIVHWHFDRQWRRHTIEPVQSPDVFSPPLTTGYFINPCAVVSIIVLPDAQGWVSLQANGLLSYWSGYTHERCYQVASTGSPRCMALHPRHPLLAIGLKHDAQHRGAGVVLLDISAWIKPASRWPWPSHHRPIALDRLYPSPRI